MTSKRTTGAPVPMWARWALAIVVGVAVIAGIVIAVDRAGPEGATTEAGAEAEINRISDIAISEDEAPRSAVLARGSAPVAALERAIAGDVRQRIADTQLTGPLQSVTCRPAGAASGGRSPYSCTVRSASIAYPFLAVLDDGRHRLTWCKIDQPAVANAGPEIPVSASCRA
jgi:hypothetical protein